MDLEQFIDPTQLSFQHNRYNQINILIQSYFREIRKHSSFPNLHSRRLVYSNTKLKHFNNQLKFIKQKQTISFCFKNANISKGVVLYRHSKYIIAQKQSLRWISQQKRKQQKKILEQLNNNRCQIIKQIQQCQFNDEREPLLKYGTSIYDEYRAFTDKDYIEKFQQYQTMNIEEDEQQSLEAHPQWRQKVNVMSFQTNQFLSKFQTSQKDYVYMLKFNNQGEMFLGHDLGNNSFLWKLNKSSKLFQLNNKNRPTSDLCFGNEGSVFESIYNSSSRPHFGIYDLLLPDTKNIVADLKFTGTDILFSTPMNSILIGNSKNGSLTFEIPMVEIMFIKLNQYENKILCACNKGTIKFVDCKSLQIIQDLKPFNMVGILIFLKKKVNLRL